MASFARNLMHISSNVSFSVLSGKNNDMSICDSIPGGSLVSYLDTTKMGVTLPVVRQQRIY